MSDYQYGYCKCGCGRKTNIAKANDPRCGSIKGEPVNYCPGHGARGKKRSAETRAKMSLAQMGNKKWLGRKHKEESKKKIGEANARRIVTEETRKKMSLRRGENSPTWRGGTTKFPYADDFTHQLREQIRNRDGRVCQVCGKTEEDDLKSLHVHHVDYDRMNSEPFNLISLCISCHMSTNYNREIWMELFTEKMVEIYNPETMLACCG